MATDASGRPWRETADGLVVTVRLTPRAGRDRLDGVGEAEGRAVLRARVAAPPVDGAANAALVRLLAKAAGIALSAVEVTAGVAARTKQVRLPGEPRVLAARLSAHLEAQAVRG